MSPWGSGELTPLDLAGAERSPVSLAAFRVGDQNPGSRIRTLHSKSGRRSSAQTRRGRHSAWILSGGSPCPPLATPVACTRKASGRSPALCSNSGSSRSRTSVDSVEARGTEKNPHSRVKPGRARAVKEQISIFLEGAPIKERTRFPAVGNDDALACKHDAAITAAGHDSAAGPGRGIVPDADCRVTVDDLATHTVGSNARRSQEGERYDGSESQNRMPHTSYLQQ